MAGLLLAVACAWTGSGCSAVRVRGPNARPWPQNAVDREIRRLSEQAVAELGSPAGPAQDARLGAMRERLRRLPREESLGHRLDRALLAGHLERSLRAPAETRGSTRASDRPEARLGAAQTQRAQALLEALVAAGLGEARGLAPARTATSAEDAVMRALADRVRPDLPLSPARARFETPDFRAAWVGLGPRFLADLGLAAEPPARGTGGGLALSYEHLRAQRGPRFRPWDTLRVLLGLGSDDPGLVRGALLELGLLGPN